MKIISVLVTILFLFPGDGFPAEANRFFSKDNMIANSLKMLGKGYVYQADINQAKKRKIRQLQAMSSFQYEKHYREIYSYIGEVGKNFGFQKNMPKERLIEKIETLDKKTIYEMIDSVPNGNISKRFHQELHRIMAEIPTGNPRDKVSFIWNRVVHRINQLKGPS